MDEAGTVLATGRLPEGVAGIGRLHELIGRFLPAADGDAEVQVGIETDRGPWVAALLAAGYVVFAVNPLQASRYRGRRGVSGAKSDPLTELREGLGQVSGRLGVWVSTVADRGTDGDAPRDLSRLVAPLLGSLEATGDLFEPFRLIDVSGVVVAPAAAYFRELAACGRPAATHRSYGMDVLRWFRFLWAAGGLLGSGDQC